ncbi:hypothetical protein Scep_008001 [Stephania cephalantha]|uniref:Uncharacterized protein n=1 Tax=Stephania cephalantha TaxID=152367 RepID=A0AAP0PNR8_9MAGN
MICFAFCCAWGAQSIRLSWITSAAHDGKFRLSFGDLAELKDQSEHPIKKKEQLEQDSA